MNLFTLLFVCTPIDEQMRKNLVMKLVFCSCVPRLT